MERNTPFEKMRMESADMIGKNVEKIAELFPECVTEAADQDGKIRRLVDFEKLREILSGDVAEEPERYDFTWVGKSAALAEAHTPIRKTLRPCPKESRDWDITQNLYIEGDNLDVLKLLQESYIGKVKVIYIDPPYNTGSDSFVYPDNYRADDDEYDAQGEFLDSYGNKVFKENNNTRPRFHSDWCSMLFSRLVLARDFLSDNGILLISIDDNELHNLIHMCDEVFGCNNHLVTMVVNRPSETATDKIVKKHEYCIAYVRNIDAFTLGQNEKNTLSRGTVGNAKQTMPVITFPKGLKCLNVADGTYVSTRKIPGSMENIENLTPIIVKNGCLAESIQLKARWRSSNDMRNFFNNDCKPTEAKINGLIEEIFFEGDRFMPQIKKRIQEKIPSMYLDNKKGGTLLSKLAIPFSYPKDVSFIVFLLRTASDKNSIIMDFFSGSSTTAHAVMQLNAEDGGSRRYIMVQFPEVCNPKSDELTDGYSNLCEIGKERIRRAGDMIKADNSLTTQSLDIGFRVLKVDSTNMNDIYYGASEVSQDLIKSTESNIKDDRTDLDLLFGCLLDWGVPLSYPYKSEEIDGATVHDYNDGDLIACFAESISEKVVEEIARRKPTRAVFRDSCFASDAAKINVTELFKRYSPDTRIKTI